MSAYGRSPVGREMWIPGLGMYAVILADSKLQTIGDHNVLERR
jgi:hypothetical protein